MRTYLYSLLLGVVLLVGVLPVYAEVELNSASIKELQAVRGIGPAKARAIVKWRKRYGAFRSIDDLKQVAGFGEKSLARLREQLTVLAPPDDKLRYPLERRQGR